jgi:NitT/TauT family transport system ATP-binding protein
MLQVPTLEADAHPAYEASPAIEEQDVLVELAGVGKTFRRRHHEVTALSDVDLRVREGEFVCLLGPSGCGKSTLLRIVAGTLAPDAGRVRVAGRAVNAPGADRGMLFQSPMLFPWLTTRENVMFGPRAQRRRSSGGSSRAAIRDRADEILETVGLGGFADAYPHELSGGMRHRAAFARAIITRPAVLLMDEPFGALDAITRIRMQDFLLSMWERYRITIIFVTHDIEEAVLLGDRVCVMGATPPRVTHELDIRLGRPRGYQEVETEAFLGIKRSVRAALAL